MTAQPTPNLGAQPTGRTPTEAAQPAQPIEVGAQPTPPTAHHGQPAHWAFGIAILLWAVGALAQWAGYPAQAYAGLALGGAAMGVGAGYWAAHRACRTPIEPADAWAPMSDAQAHALLQLAAQPRQQDVADPHGPVA